MNKSDINLDHAISLYNDCGSLHKVAKELHTSHIRLSKLFKENGISINNVGKSRVMTEEELSSAISDYVDGKMKMEAISKKYAIRPHKLRKLFKENGVKISKWNGHIKKVKKKKEKKVKPILQLKKCPYCEWSTTDIHNKSHAYQKHLVHVHNIDVSEHIQKHPEDREFLSGELNRKNNKIQCKICGKWLSLIDDRHLRKHGITKQEYIEKFSSPQIITTTTLNKLRKNMEKMMENDSWERKSSKYEDEIEAFLLESNVTFERHNRLVLNGRELDFLIGNYAIEFNGNKFHTEFFGGKMPSYHLDKTMACNNAGIHLIQIFEDEYYFHKDIVFNKLRHILKIDSDVKQKIDGRKCDIMEISSSDAFDFLEKNHIQGGTNSTVYIGAFNNGNLIAVMTFLKEKGGVWNLNRFASDNKFICRGVGGKLFKWFIRNYNPKYIKSFADRRWTSNSDNNVYTKLGFYLDGVVKPTYTYYNEKINKYRRIHKFNFRKQTLHKKYGLPLSMTETEMARKLGYDRIWDCGLFKYVWKKMDE